MTKVMGNTQTVSPTMALLVRILVITVQSKNWLLILGALGIVALASGFIAYIELIENLSLNKWIKLTTYIASGPLYALTTSVTQGFDLVSLVFLLVVALLLAYLIHRWLKRQTILSFGISVSAWLFVGYTFAVLVWL
jgi:hypothetical protein